MTAAQRADLAAAVAASLRPPPDMDLAEWSEEHIRLSPEDSAIRGPFRAWPFQIEPLQVLSPRHECSEVVLLCASQTLKTRSMLNLLAYAIAADPGPVLFVTPTAGDAEVLSKDRVDPMLRDVPALRGLVAEATVRATGNTIYHKRFRGGQVSFAYATSPSQLAARPIRYLLLDEVSRYEPSAGNEGDPVSIALARTATFSGSRKVVYASSPTVDGQCRISGLYEQSDRREWQVPCPHCGHYQVLTWPGVRWGLVACRDEAGSEVEVTVSPRDPQYQCEECLRLIGQHARSGMSARGRWVATNPDGHCPGFRLNALASPVRDWADLVAQWLGAQGDQEQLQAFVNTVLAEPWAGRGEAPDWEKVQSRAANYEMGAAPRGVLFLTAGMDVQADRVEVYVWGWGRDKRSWLVDHVVCGGDPNGAAVWRAVDEVIARSWRHESGIDLPLRQVAVDSGHAALSVYDWARRQGSSRVMVVKGTATGPALLGTPASGMVSRAGRRERGGALIWPVNVSLAKAEFYGWLNQDRPAGEEKAPAGWVHLPADVPDEVCRQLVAEHYVRRKIGGHLSGEWRQVYQRNEALDCRNYARAAAEHLGVSKFGDSHWAAQEAMFPAAAIGGKIQEKAEPTRAKPKRGEDWFGGDRWRGF